MRAVVSLGLGLWLGACSCGPTPTSDVPDGGAVFIALQREFEHFRDWTNFEVQAEAVPVGHPEGRSFIYVNRMPPPGPRRFPVGTILVKTVESGAPSEWAIHAMVKRGGSFGWQNGTVGWEFFELRFNDDEVPVVLWRGPGPPSGSGYRVAGASSSTAQLVCADCHAPAWQNDSVLNERVRLVH